MSEDWKVWDRWVIADATGRASIRRMLEEDARECPWCSASLTPGQTVCAIVRRAPER